jgi:AcrR family transcriptional regulator
MATSRAPGRRRRLNRAEIIEASVEILDRGELSELSMRGLAERLGVTPMALYTHVADKDEILDELLDAALRRNAAPEPPPRSTSWRPWMERFATTLRDLLLQHPVLLDRYLRAPVGVPAALERMEAGLAVLVRAGFDDETAVEIFATVHTFTLGCTALEAARAHGRRPTGDLRLAPAFDERSTGYWAAYFGSLDVEAFPSLHRIRPDLAAFTSPPRFHQGLRRLLRGFSVPTATRPARR